MAADIHATARSIGKIALVMVSCPVLIGAAPPPERSTADVFRIFETVCLTDIKSGYSLDVMSFIDKAGFKFLHSDHGYDVFNSYLGQLIIGEKSCSMGMPGLQFDIMLELTKGWAERRGFKVSSEQVFNTSGGKRWEWTNGSTNLALEENHFSNGISLTGLIVWRP